MFLFHILSDIGWFDVIVSILFIALEVRWYRKSKKDDQEFIALRKEIRDQLLETNRRLELILELSLEGFGLRTRPINQKSPHGRPKKYKR